MRNDPWRRIFGNLRRHHRVHQAPRCPWCGIHMRFVQNFLKRGIPVSLHVCPRCAKKLEIQR